MKKIICIALVLVFVFGMSTSAIAAKNGTAQLSELSDEEIINFLKESGVEIPQIFDDEITWALFVRNTIQQVEADPNTFLHYNYSVLHQFANEIKMAVNSYYGVSKVSRRNSRSIADILVDSIPLGEWSDDYLTYNAYGYVLGVNEEINPGVYTWVSLGNQATSYIYNGSANAYTVASWIADDLETLSYTVNTITQVNPNTQVSIHTQLVCVRIHSEGRDWYLDGNGDMVKYHEYHIMKKNTNGLWYHKPYYTMPLKYKYIPSANKIWLSEGCLGVDKEAVRKMGEVYDSEIWFIEYTTPHACEYEYCGNGKHILTCTLCGETSGSVMNCVYINGTCKQCGHYSGGTEFNP
jgi:hypothetical protein